MRFKLISLIFILHSFNANSQSLLNQYNDVQNNAIQEKNALEKARKTGSQYSCASTPTFIFSDGFVFSSSNRNDLVFIGKYNKTNNLFQFSWTQSGGSDVMYARGELDLINNKLYKQFSRNPNQFNEPVIKVDCVKDK